MPGMNTIVFRCTFHVITWLPVSCCNISRCVWKNRHVGIDSVYNPKYTKNLCDTNLSMLEWIKIRLVKVRLEWVKIKIEGWKAHRRIGQSAISSQFKLINHKSRHNQQFCWFSVLPMKWSAVLPPVGTNLVNLRSWKPFFTNYVVS